MWVEQGGALSIGGSRGVATPLAYSGYSYPLSPSLPPAIVLLSCSPAWAEVE